MRQSNACRQSQVVFAKADDCFLTSKVKESRHTPLPVKAKSVIQVKQICYLQADSNALVPQHKVRYCNLDIRIQHHISQVLLITVFLIAVIL